MRTIVGGVNSDLLMTKNPNKDQKMQDAHETMKPMVYQYNMALVR
jgi:hypothetical protein